MKHAVAIVKIVLIAGSFVLTGNFLVNKLLNLNIRWAVDIMAILGGLMAGYIWHDTFSDNNVLDKLGVRDKIIAVVTLVVLLTIAYFPESQGIKKQGINIVFLVLAILITAPCWWYIYKKEKDQA